MVYRKKFVAVVKVNGKVLREQDDVVTLPFGSEYEILLKNLDSRNASVAITIDGKDVLDGKLLIVHPLVDETIKGFIDGMTAVNRFKFIQKTEKIIEHRGDFVEDGLIRIEYTFEKKIEKKIIQETVYRSNRCIYGYSSCIGCYRPCRLGNNWTTNYYMSSSNNIGSTLGDISGSSGTYSSSGTSREAKFTSKVENLCALNDSNLFKPNEDEGITVKGNDISQEFSYGTIGELEDTSEVIIIKLRGVNSQGAPVTKVVGVSTKLKCTTCGLNNDSKNKFCTECGTRLG